MLNRKIVAHILFATFIAWFLFQATLFFSSTPIPILSLMPDLLLLCVFIVAAFAIGSYVLEVIRLDEVSPIEDFVFATVIGIGFMGLFGVIISVTGLLNWWVIAIGFTLVIIAGFRRIVGLLTPPAYLFGPDDSSEDGLSLLAWLQVILMSLWIAVLFHFVLLPPVIADSLHLPLGETQQWVINGGIVTDEYVGGQSVSLTTGLFALALAIRGPHLAMLFSGLFAALTLLSLYSMTKRYSGPTVGRSTLLIAASLPMFSYLLLNPGDGMLLALFQLCSFYSMMRWFDEKKRRWALASGAFLGFSLTVSITSIFFVVPTLIIALIWALRQQNIGRFLLHLVVASGGVLIWLLPWIGLHFYVYFDALHLINPLWSISVPDPGAAAMAVVNIPLQLSFPSEDLDKWFVVGPIFLIFIPFYFLTQRKNPMATMATAIGLVTVVIGRPFGVLLDDRLIAVLLLSIPTAMATHRFSEVEWKKSVHVFAMLCLVFWYFYHATSVVEDQFDSPHRYILGIESEEEYLSQAVPYYADAQEINTIVDSSDRILSLNHAKRLYFTRPVVHARSGVFSEILEIYQESGGINPLIVSLAEDGFTHILVDWKDPAVNSSEVFRSLLADLESRLLFTGTTLKLYSIQ
jgi:hypothetical protein